MQKWILSAEIFLCLLPLTSTYLSESVQAQSEDPSYCDQIEDFARNTMIARQSGTSSLKSILEIYQSNEYPRELTKIIIEAFEGPRYNNKSMSKIAINEFANNHYLACIKQREKQ